MPNNTSAMQIYDLPEASNPLKRTKRNVYINGKRTSISMESYIWDEIDQISANENMTVDELCTKIYEHCNKRFSIPSVMRYISVEVKNHYHQDVFMHGEMAEEKLSFPSPFYVALQRLSKEDHLLDH